MHGIDCRNNDNTIIYLIFKDIPLSDIVAGTNTTNYIYGASIGLICQAISRPMTVISWTKNGAPIISGGNVVIINASTSPTLAKSLLLFKGLMLSNNGDYRCIGNYSSGSEIKQSSIITISEFIFCINTCFAQRINLRNLYVDYHMQFLNDTPFVISIF